jgi:hypothetical protein
VGVVELFSLIQATGTHLPPISKLLTHIFLARFNAKNMDWTLAWLYRSPNDKALINLVMQATKDALYVCDCTFSFE